MQKRVNQVVLHDQVTANVYDILLEFPEDLIHTEWDIEDISVAYNELIINKPETAPKSSFRRLNKQEKDAVRKQRKEMQALLKREMNSKKRNLYISDSKATI